jgi:hypothetical protein
MESGVACGAICGTVCELINCVVVITIGGITSWVVISFEVANFVVGICELGTVIPGFTFEVVVDVIAKGAGTVVTIFNRFDSAQSVVLVGGNFTALIFGFDLTIDLVVFISGSISPRIFNEFDISKSIVLGILSEDVVGIDGFDATVE